MNGLKLVEGFDDLNVACRGVEVINESERLSRSLPIFIEDLSGKGLKHNLLDGIPLEAPRTVVCSYDNPRVRGVECVVTEDDYILTRFQRDEFNRLRLFSDGIMGQFGSPDSGIRVDGGNIFADPKEDVELTGDFALISPEEAYNYGMWLLQAIPYIDHLRSTGFDGQYLCFCDAGWQASFLEFMGLGDRLVRQERGRAYKINGSLKAFRHDYRNLVLSSKDREAFSRLKNEPRISDASAPHDAIFISRRQRSVANPKYRSLLNEDELIDAVKQLGFHVVEPEYLGFAEQISLFRQARIVIGLGGAGMFNAVFCEPGTKIVTIESSNNWIEAHANLFSSAGLSYGVIFGSEEDDDEQLYRRPWTVNVPAAINAIRKAL